MMLRVEHAVEKWGIAPKSWETSKGWAYLLGKHISILFICVEFNLGKGFIKTIGVSFETRQSRMLREMLIYLEVLQTEFRLFCFTL